MRKLSFGEGWLTLCWIHMKKNMCQRIAGVVVVSCWAHGAYSLWLQGCGGCGFCALCRYRQRRCCGSCAQAYVATRPWRAWVWGCCLGLPENRHSNFHGENDDSPWEYWAHYFQTNLFAGGVWARNIQELHGQHSWTLGSSSESRSRYTILNHIVQ